MGRDRPGRFHELASTGNPLDVQGDNLGVRTGAEIFHAINDIDIGLVPDAQGGAESQAVAMEIIEHLRNEASAL